MDFHSRTKNYSVNELSEYTTAGAAMATPLVMCGIGQTTAIHLLYNRVSVAILTFTAIFGTTHSEPSFHFLSGTKW